MSDASAVDPAADSPVESTGASEHDASAQDAVGQDTSSQDATGPDTAGQDTSSQDATGQDATGQDAGEPDLATLLEREGDVAADYLEGLLDIADLDGDIDMDVEGDRAAVSIVGGDLSSLVGKSGQVLEALQELTRMAVHRQTGQRTRLMLDIDGFREGRRETMTALGRQTVEEVSASGESKRLQPMTPFERKVVHDVVTDAGLRSESEGAEPERRIVVYPS